MCCRPKRVITRLKQASNWGRSEEEGERKGEKDENVQGYTMQAATYAEYLLY